MKNGAARPLRILLTAGPTREPIDPVRYLSNYSTGYMGAQLATEALRRGHRVTVVHGPTAEPFPDGATAISVERTAEMARALRRHAPRADAVIMAAAVADFRPVRPSRVKLPRAGRRLIALKATPDLLKTLPRQSGQIVVGFALETEQVLDRARRKLREKGVDLLLAQRAGPVKSPFGRTRVRAWLLSREGTIEALGTREKPSISRLLLDKIEALWYGQPIQSRRVKNAR